MATAPQTCEAYVIDRDGTRRPLNVEFVNQPRTAAGRTWAPPCNPPQAAPRRPRSLHLFRRLIGGLLMLIGLPLLILPGPGVLFLALGLLLMLKP